MEEKKSVLVSKTEKAPVVKAKAKSKPVVKKVVEAPKPMPKAVPVVSEVKVEKESSQSIKTYLIKKGDTLSEIALRFFGAKKLYDYNSGPMRKIMELNPTVKNPDMIFAGAQLVLPGRNIASEETTQVETQPKLDKQPEDELFWSQKERKDSLNPDFSYINFDDKIDIDFENSCDNLTFKIS